MNTTVAKAHSAHLLIGARSMSIDIDSALMPILDALILSFIICEEKRREAQRSNSAAASGLVRVRFRPFEKMTHISFVS